MQKYFYKNKSYDFGKINYSGNLSLKLNKHNLHI